MKEWQKAGHEKSLQNSMWNREDVYGTICYVSKKILSSLRTTRELNKVIFPHST